METQKIENSSMYGLFGNESMTRYVDNSLNSKAHEFNKRKDNGNNLQKPKKKRK